MGHGSRICPHCGALNAIDEKTCHRCDKRLPGAVASSVSGLAADFSADGVPGTKLMAGMCIVVYGLCMLGEAGRGGVPGFEPFRSWNTIHFGALVGRDAFMLLGGVHYSEEPWRLFSAVFVHSSIWHVGLNLLGVVNLGRTLEPHFRTARFLVLYVLSGVLGYVATLIWRGDMAFSVGTSGSLFGLLGAYIAALLVRRNPGWHRVFVSNLILVVALAYFASNIDHAAHVGGFVSGFLIGLGLELEPQPRRRDRLMAIPAGILVVASVASIALSVSSPMWKEVKQRQEAARLGRNSE
jgi:rhomboid protease GluP